MSNKVIGLSVIYRPDPIESFDSVGSSDSNEPHSHDSVSRKPLFRESKSEILHLVSEFFGYRWCPLLLSDVIYDYKPDECLYDWFFTYNSVNYWLHNDPGCTTLYRPCGCSFDCKKHFSGFCPERSFHHHCSFARGQKWFSVNHRFYG